MADGTAPRGRFLGRRCLLATLACLTASAAAANPFGVGMAEPAVAPGGGPLGAVVGWIAVQQTAFYRAMTDALAGVADGGAGGFLLVGLGFLYGIFHAAGPGHGKAVISAYAVADRQTALRAVAVSFAAAFVQASVAVVLVLVAITVLGMTSIAIGATARWIEVASYGALVAFGLVLVWRKLVSPLLPPPTRAATAGPRALSAAASPAVDHGEAASCCGHGHAVSPAAATERRGIAGAAALAVSVGLRPCSGAIIVLVFAYAQGLLAYGIAATYAMGLGVGLTVAAIASFAVLARDGAGLALAGRAGFAGLAFRLIEAAAAVAVLSLGVLFLAAAIAR